MKIGVSSYSFSRLLKQGMNYYEACDQAREMGYAGIEFIDLDLQHGRGEGAIEELAGKLRAHCEDIGLAIPAYTVGADFLNREGEVARVKGCADIAKVLGAGVLRHDAFWSMPGLRDWRQAVSRIAPAIREVAQYAQGLGLRTCTENHGLIMQDALRVEWMINEVNHSNYGWLVDIGNFLCADEDPAYAVGIAAPYAFHAHVKDFLVKPGAWDAPQGGWFRSRGGNHLRGTVIGDGAVPVRQCVGILQRAAYDGWLSVEFEGAEEVLPALTSARKFLAGLGL
jgi:sugar phosphate isomerase/epimerase